MSGVDISAEAVAMSPEQQAAASITRTICELGDDAEIAGQAAVESISAAGLVIVSAARLAKLLDELMTANRMIADYGATIDRAGEMWRDERARRERAEAALRAAFAMRVTNHPEWEAIARAALAQEAGTDGR